MIRARIRMFGRRMVVLLDKPRFARAVEPAPAQGCLPQERGRVEMHPGAMHVHALTTAIAHALLAENGLVSRISG